jgi:hypothetical protein
MSVTHTVVTNCRVNAENYLTGSQELTVDSSELTSDTVNANAVANTVSIAPFQFAKLRGIFLLADGNVSVTFRDGASNVTCNLVADEPMEWHYGNNLAANPFTANVASVDATETLGANVLLQARISKIA